MSTQSTASNRRTPSGVKSQQRVREILQAGREVFAEKGYDGATSAEIAQRAGISEATVFSYFSGKRELCARVIADWYDEIIDAFETGMPRDGSVRQQFAFIVRTHLRLMLMNGTGLCALVLSEGRTRQHDLSDTLTELQRRYTAPLMDVLARGQTLGHVRGDVPLRLLRSLVFGPMEHVLWDATLAKRRLSQTQIETTANELVEVLWAALQPADAKTAALAQFRQDVEDASRRYEAASSEEKPLT
ncbi:MULTISPECIES: TetR/AcrR family transcriptional regulator [unclassified Caballeronia]|jgi:AcrR family transcriptional regulator|uniref:TetR/AcrR family transcriptional regulator n=1 Tax=unclassified Caballeronia TaxID=2646786 RepID=UPI0020289C1E|nr:MULTISPECIES: TetR/AcrR family transcriptional regulator [unclassified Caballeronia]MDR5775229.1 TetR/AcrR family transcriptional regulator [Caballeronia sp. LZ002]MDR5800780.1 TetR/AcrR family transcriptional regulator [Caballeronia sp. LZ001]MDR5850667.1 TetR/AcrR family transcriptional regulator [Caballeronia sp. LZ003]